MKQYFTKTVQYQILLRISGIVLLLASGLCNSARAQCTAPDAVAHSRTSSTCQSNGSITLGAASGGQGDTLQYALYDASNSTEVRPWQASTLFSDLASGSYTLRVRYVCPTGFSPVYTKAVTVGGNYTPPSITGITVQRRAQCNNGRIRITSTGGRNPKTYALVSALNATEPVATADYIRQPQSSNIFDGLAAGTYYARVYDACGSYATNSVTVDSFTQNFPFLDKPRIRYWLCDSLTGEVILGNLADNVIFTDDALKRVWVTFPDGSTDTLPHPNSSGYSVTPFNFPMSKLGPVGPGYFPDNIGGTWPKPLRIGYRDACGNEYIGDYDFSKPDLGIYFQRNILSAAHTCDSTAYVFNILDFAPSNVDTLFSLYSVNMNNNAFFSLDSGNTWQAVTTTGNLSQDILLAIGSSYNVCIAYCGDTACLSGTVPPLSPIVTSLYESNRYACIGNSGLELTFTSGVRPIAVEMLSGPPGQSWINDTLYSVGSFRYLASSRNMLPGDYIFRFTDSCGQVKEVPVSLEYPYQLFDYSYAFPCGSSDMKISFINDTIREISMNRALSRVSSGLRGGIYNPDSTLATPTEYTSNSSTGVLTIPGSAISSLPNGNYFIRIWKVGADSCVFVDKPWEKTSSLISLSNSLAVSSCPGSPSTGTIVAMAQGASGGNSYSLYTGSVSPATLVAGPQPSAIFNDLNESTTYIVTVSDSCGRGSQASLSFNGTPLPVYNNAGGQMPCPGDSLALFVNDIPEVTYQWYKNDTSLPGDTMPVYSVANVQPSDSGAYKVKLNIGTCNIFLASFRLSPNECGTPLRVSFLSFTARPAAGKVLLDWSTATERTSEGFDIERSANGTDWDAIGYVASLSENGNSSERLDYSYPDNRPAPGVNYYRLRQIDTDGSSSYSDTRQVFFRAGGQALQFYPNPTQRPDHRRAGRRGDNKSVQYLRAGSTTSRRHAAEDIPGPEQPAGRHIPGTGHRPIWQQYV